MGRAYKHGGTLPLTGAAPPLPHQVHGPPFLRLRKLARTGMALAKCCRLLACTSRKLDAPHLIGHAAAHVLPHSSTVPASPAATPRLPCWQGGCLLLALRLLDCVLAPPELKLQPSMFSWLCTAGGACGSLHAAPLAHP